MHTRLDQHFNRGKGSAFGNASLGAASVKCDLNELVDYHNTTILWEEHVADGTIGDLSSPQSPRSFLWPHW